MIYVVLPIYNEEDALVPLIKSLSRALSRKKIAFRIIACNDGSRDKSERILSRLQREFPLDVITHRINRGLGETVRDLFERAAELSKTDDIIVRLDADNTHDPKIIPLMVKKLESGFDVITASRFEEGGGQKGVSFYRAVVSYCAQLFAKVAFQMWDIREFTCGFRAYRAAIIKKAIDVYGNNFIQLKGLGFTCTIEKLIKLHLLGARVGEIGFILRYDKKQSSSKMVASITMLGYFILALLYNWPFTGWRAQAKKSLTNVKSTT